MSGMFSDLTENYLDKLYDDLSKEQMRLMTEMKNCKDAESNSKEQDIQKQLSYLNTLMINTLRLRNLKKKIMLKINSA
jgi:predicted aldo/keto reductase-like oxidoreductase